MSRTPVGDPLVSAVLRASAAVVRTPRSAGRRYVGPVTIHVDPEWAEKRFTWWIETVRRAFQQEDPGYTWCEPNQYTDELLDQEDQVRQAVTAVLGAESDAPLVERIPGIYSGLELQHGLDLVQRARGRLRTDSETREFVRGTRAPSMAADEFHEVVWSAAAKLWEDGHHSAAIQRAATFLNAHVQSLVSRTDVADQALMAQAFSTAGPEPGKPRLRWPGDDQDLTVRAMRSGLLSLSQGVYAAIRNPATHGIDDIPRQIALEQLATLSVLARWIDQCELVTSGQ